VDLNSTLLIEFLSDPGKIRPLNEDCIAVKASSGVVVLADGMGGYNAGEVASALAVNIISRGIEAVLPLISASSREESKIQIESLVRKEVQLANEAIFRKSRQDPNCSGMGTTLVMGLFYDNFLTVAHLGDSRLYRMRGNSFIQVTKDHSLLQEQLDAGLISVEEARFSTNKNFVTRALGVDPVAETETNCYEVLAGDLYLFCSDGLNDLVSDEEIQIVLATGSDNLAKVAHDLVQLANDSGGRDNISVVLVKVLKDFGVLSSKTNH
jgi:serine/threonine protein phosphatase PrpC